MIERWLQSSRVVLPDGVRPAAVAVRGGRITAVEPSAPAGRSVTDLGALVLSPGLVDCHVHINEPGRTEWEGFDTATRAAAAGGVTTLVDMPLNCLPVTTTRAALEQKLLACSNRCFVDVGFWGGVVPGNVADLSELGRAGVLGCKAFLVHSGIDEFPNATEEDLKQAMPVLREHGLPLLAHAELDLGAPHGEGSPQAYRSFLESRPPVWEEAAIELLIGLCRKTRCHVHIVHLSAASSLDLLRDAKAEGLPITVETCPHYLCFDAESIPDGATEYKCAPPIRGRENRDALWRGLLEGVIDFVITDHSPCTPGLKRMGHGDFQAAWGGISSLQLGLPALWTEARQRGASLEQLCRWVSSAPAAFAGLSRKKGKIAAGMQADFVVWDPDESFRVQEQDLFFRHKHSPYLSREMFGRVFQTWLAGEVVFEGAAHAGAPRGQLVLHRDDRA